MLKLHFEHYDKGIHKQKLRFYEPTWVDNHVAMQVVWQVELFSTAWMRTNLGSPFPVNEVYVILQRVEQ